MMYNTIKKFLRTARPSKQQFFHYLFEDVKKIPKGSLVVDIASYNGMNADIFQEHRYVAIDLDLDILKKITKKCEYKIQANILRLPFTSDSLEAVVSSHTLSHLSFADRLKAINELARVVKPGGFFIFNVPLFGENKKRIGLGVFKEIIEKDFVVLRVAPYRGIINRLFETTVMMWFKSKKSRGLIVTKIYTLLTLISFSIEYITGSYKLLSGKVYFCLRKKGDEKKAADNNIFSMLACPTDKHTLRGVGVEKMECLNCGRIYKIADGIMELVVSI